MRVLTIPIDLINYPNYLKHSNCFNNSNHLSYSKYSNLNSPDRLYSPNRKPNTQQKTLNPKPYETAPTTDKAPIPFSQVSIPFRTPYSELDLVNGCSLLNNTLQTDHCFVYIRPQERMEEAKRKAWSSESVARRNWLRDPYNSSLTLPLLDFIKHPLVASTIHNGAAYQVGQGHQLSQ